jgi:hypothetical protein
MQGLLRPIQLAFSGNALMFLAGTLDAIFELAPIVRQLLGHFVGSARHVATYHGPKIYDLADVEFM